MALPTSGQMTAAMINTELGRSPTAAFSIDGVAERTLAEVPSGSIAFSDFYGKSSALLRTTITIGTGETWHKYSGSTTLDSGGLMVGYGIDIFGVRYGSVGNPYFAGETISTLYESIETYQNRPDTKGSYFTLIGLNRPNSWTSLTLGDLKTNRVGDGQSYNQNSRNPDRTAWGKTGQINTIDRRYIYASKRSGTHSLIIE